MKQDGRIKVHKLRIKLCDTDDIFVNTITNVEHHIGNFIAEGKVTPEEGWRALAVYFKKKHKHNLETIEVLRATTWYNLAWREFKKFLYHEN